MWSLLQGGGGGVGWWMFESWRLRAAMVRPERARGEGQAIFDIACAACCLGGRVRGNLKCKVGPILACCLIKKGLLVVALEVTWRKVLVKKKGQAIFASGSSQLYWTGWL